MSRSGRRGPWLPEEDAALLHLVRTQGPNNWVRISEHMQHRSPKQCRERYHQNLKPSLNHDPISAEEGEVIEQLVRDMGKRWAEIARRLGNRSDNAVKNWWNGSMNRRKRNTGSHGAVAKMVGYRTQPILASASSLPLKQLYLPEQLVLPPFSVSDPFHRPELSPSSTLGMRPDRRYDLLPRPEGRQLSVQTDCRSLLYPGCDQQIPSPLQPHSASALPSPGGKPLLGLHNWSPSRLECQLPPLNWTEGPVPSPAATEASQGSFPQQAPSLVSDNQSNCSISPKTVTSPRPGGTVGKLPSLDLWPEMHRRNSTGNYPDAEIDGSWKGRAQQDLRPYRSAERADSVIPEVTIITSSPNLPSSQNAATHLPSLNTAVRYSPGPSSGKPSSPIEKDTRMNVARLLE